MSVLRINRRGYLPTFIDLGPSRGAMANPNIGGAMVEAQKPARAIVATTPEQLEKRRRNKAAQRAREAA